MARICREEGIARKTFYVWLKKYKLSKPNLRHLEFRDKRYKDKVKISRLHPKDRLLLISKIENHEETVTSICLRYNISRKTFYKWLKRYKAKGENALYDIKIEGELHPRSIGAAHKRTVLNLVVEHPEYSVHRLNRELDFIGHHGIQNILYKEDLNTTAKRQLYSQGFVETPAPFVAPLYKPQMPLYKLRQILSPFSGIPRAFAANPRVGFAVTLVSLVPLTLIFLWLTVFVTSAASVSRIGLFFASIALTFGLFFFIYSLKYYITILMVLHLAQTGGVAGRKNRKMPTGIRLKIENMLSLTREFMTGGQSRTTNSLMVNLAKVTLSKKPFVSVHLAMYNEKMVVERLIRACTTQDWIDEKSGRANYEVVVADDSNDNTTDIVKELLSGGNRTLVEQLKNDVMEVFVSKSSNIAEPTVKLIHRFSRKGFKGGALQVALEATEAKAEYIAVFDADFVPFADTIEQFMKSFQETCGGLDKVAASKIAAVQGYQWHVLNKSQTWVTRGVRTEYSGSYVIERAGEEIYKGLKQISGSVYAIRTDVLRQFGWGSSITEDFELTLRLYEAGYKVAYTPYIQAPAEAVSTIKRLTKQRMRWAEGASYNVKVMFARMLKSENMSPAEKAEFAYLAPYYLQAAFFVVGTFCWFFAEAVLGTRLPFWSAAFGWSLVITNIISLPLMNIVGLFLEESDERDYVGIFSFVALSYVLVPFQAYAAIKGFLEKEEGTWFRTPKTGAVTDIFDRSPFAKFFEGLVRARPKLVAVGLKSERASITSALDLAVKSAYNNFNLNQLATVAAQLPHFRRPNIWVARAALSILLIFSLSLFYFSRGIPIAEATNMAGPLKLSTGTGDGVPYQNVMSNEQTYASASTLIPVGNQYANRSANNHIWFTNLLPTGGCCGPNAQIPGGNYYVQFAKQGNGTLANNGQNIAMQLYLMSNTGTGRTILVANTYHIRTNNADNTLMQFSLGNLVGNNITHAASNRLAFWIFARNGDTTGCTTNNNCFFNIAINNTNIPARLIIPAAGITVPEIPKPLVLAILLVVMPVLPAIVSGRYRKKGRNVVEEFGVAWKDLIRKLLGYPDELLDELPV